MAQPANREFDIRGVNHLALVCKDMAKTVEFYRDVLGMPLVKTIDLPNGMGQHFFFDIGNGDSLAFFWFPDSPAAAPGVAAPAQLPGGGDIRSAHGSMNHIAFNVPADKFDAYVEKLKAKGIETGPVLNHDNSPNQVSPEVTDDVFVRSVYFWDPDGVMLEFASWTHTGFTEKDVAHEAVDAEGRKSRPVVLKAPVRQLEAAK
ncbi:VOC family protein [Phenylobacterium sp. SCN 70-31]|uniref:VOC family protein n=1 Tax=Phenylobacterium sp. SCN 70-31 TaxID=1660129 RepID=UPI00086B41FE|nr:VOC family protein [Phenylobacterium sp. SCN 70-31]ODT88610.1 MAG: glyoxalase [Phenylobacterium sp. SCN 70-31]